MVDLKGYVESLYFDTNGDQMLLLRLTDDIRPYYDELKDKLLSICIKVFRQKRSNNANAFCWELCTKLGNKLRISKEEVYLNALKHYGQSEIFSVLSSIDVKGYFKYFEEFGTGTVNGKEFTHYKVYKGSSEYDTEEMSILLDGLVCDAKEQGIQVLTASEIDLLKREWKP